MEETKHLMNGIDGWIDSLKEYPENDSANGLFEYLADGCNIIISLNHAYLIYRLRTLFNYVISHGIQTQEDFKFELEMLIDFAPIKIRLGKELKERSEAEEQEAKEMEKENQYLSQLDDELLNEISKTLQAYETEIQALRKRYNS